VPLFFQYFLSVFVPLGIGVGLFCSAFELGHRAIGQPPPMRTVVLLPASALVYARLDALMKGLDEGTFVEAHRLDDNLSERIPKVMIGRRLNQDEAKKLLAKLE
jgi:hypothetical protein